jgi:mevalonate kinase
VSGSRGNASGKVILFGEHAVVYGVPAIAVGIDRGAWAKTAPGAAPGRSTLHVTGWNARASDDPSEDSPLARAFRALIEVTRRDVAVPDVDVEAGADLPPGGGLGCSAALGVAVARALDPSASADVVATRAGAWEQVFHGNASGIDAAVSASGGCVLFQRNADGGRTIEKVVVPAPFHLCVGNSGQASSTKSMVEAVARYRERRPETAAKAFDGIHTLVKNARLAIEAGDKKAIGQLIDLNQMLLSGLFLSTPEIEQMCAAARAAGAYGAKLTGAGGGGSVIALVEGPAAGAAVLAAWKSDGFDGFLTTFAGDAARARIVAKIELETAP